MGVIASKFFKLESKSSKMNEEYQSESPKKTTEISDVRSPSADIVRTPIIIDKLKSELDWHRDRSLPLRTKLLKSLKLDPRSPTVGIYRTPILVEDVPSNKSSTHNCDSPLSIYSCNINDSIVQDIRTPIEPSVNVSGFEVHKEIYNEIEVTLNGEEIKDEEAGKSCLKIIDRPNTYEAKKLLEEIISDEENFLKKVKMSSRKSKKPGLKIDRNYVNDVRVKNRTPLSNITLSSNSPNQIGASIKFLNKNKVVPEFGLENSVSPTVKHLAQWDQNNTVVI